MAVKIRKGKGRVETIKGGGGMVSGVGGRLRENYISATEPGNPPTTTRTHM